MRSQYVLWKWWKPHNNLQLSSTPNTEAVYSLETLTPTHQTTTWRHKACDNMNLGRRENLKSCQKKPKYVWHISYIISVIKRHSLKQPLLVEIGTSCFAVEGATHFDLNGSSLNPYIKIYLREVYWMALQFHYFLVWNLNLTEVLQQVIVLKGDCATNQKVAGSIPDGVTGIFHWHNPSGRTMALGSTRPLTEMSTRNISWG